MLNVLPQTVAATLSLRRPWLKKEGETFIWGGEGGKEEEALIPPPPSLPLPLPMMKTRKERESCYIAQLMLYGNVCVCVGGGDAGAERRKSERRIRARKNGVEGGKRKKKMLLFLGI